MAHGATPSDNFLERLQDLPFVKDSVVKVGALYAGTKQYNFLLRITLETAETGVGVFASTTKPLLNAFEKPLGSINDLACKQLEKMEKNYPIIAQPSEEMLKQTKARVQPLADRLKPITDRVSCVTKCGMDKITSTKDYATDKVGAVSEYGMSKVNVVKSYAMDTVSNLSNVATKQVSVLMENKMCLMVLSQFEKFIQSAQLARNDNVQGTDSCQDGNVDDVSSMAAINRLWRVVDVFRYVVYDQSTKKLQCICCESSKALSKINPTKLMDWTSLKDSVSCYYYVKKDRIINLWNAINNPNYVIGENETEVSKYETGLITFLRYLKMKAGSGLTYIDGNISFSLAAVDNKLPLCVRNFMASPIKYIVVKKPYVLRELASYDQMVRDEPEPCSSSDDSNDEKKSEEDIYHSPAKHHPEDHHH